MKKTFTLLITVLLLLSFAACKGNPQSAPAAETPQAPEDPVSVEQWATFTNDDAGYSMNYPDGWEVSEDDRVVQFSSPEDGDYKLGVTVVTQVKNENLMSLDKDALEKFFDKLYTNVKFTEFKKTTVSGQEGLMYAYDFGQESARQMGVEYTFNYRDNNYSLIFWTPAEQMAVYQPVVDEMVRTFAVK